MSAFYQQPNDLLREIYQEIMNCMYEPERAYDIEGRQHSQPKRYADIVYKLKHPKVEFIFDKYAWFMHETTLLQLSKNENAYAWIWEKLSTLWNSVYNMSFTYRLSHRIIDDQIPEDLVIPDYQSIQNILKKYSHDKKLTGEMLVWFACQSVASGLANVSKSFERLSNFDTETVFQQKETSQ